MRTAPIPQFSDSHIQNLNLYVLLHIRDHFSIASKIMSSSVLGFKKRGKEGRKTEIKENEPSDLFLQKKEHAHAETAISNRLWIYV